MTNRASKEIPLFHSAEILEKYTPSGAVSDFLEEIQATNSRFNLVSRETSLPDMVQMAADSLIPLEFLPRPQGKIFDIGPGAGFPSIIILLSFPALEAILFERTMKKAGFLAGILRKFNLKGKVVPEDFLSALGKQPHGSFEYGFMKYVRPDKKLLSGVQSLLTPSGKFVYFSHFDPLSDIKASAPKCHSQKYYLDNSERVRTLCIFSK